MTGPGIAAPQPSHAQIHARFEAFLASRQANAPRGRDIRAHVLAAADRPTAFGLTRRNLAGFYPSNLPLLFPDNRALDEPGWAAAERFFGLGTIWPEAAKSHPGLSALFARPQGWEDVILFEQGFLASAGSWALSFQGRGRDYACLGYVYDDMAHYFMAEYPNRLIEKLNSDETPDAAALARARSMIDALRRERVSKYNAQPFKTAPGLLRGDRRRVLVCDQSYADASTVYGLVDERDFQDMLRDAILENPGAEILVKTHPDTAWEPDKRKGYYTGLADAGPVRVLRDPVNPFVLFDAVDTVYAATSGMGLEALFAGKRAVIYGAPFFAGWGLTEDRLCRRRPGGVPHRRRTRSLEEIFHYFYVWATIYHAPGRRAPAEIEDALQFIIDVRPEAPRPPRRAASDRPLVSVVVPVHGVERYLEQCLRSVTGQTLRDIEIIPVNDASPDGSQAIIDRMAAEDPRIRPVRLARNVGQGFARNAGLDAARGDFVWFLDADDYLCDREALARLHAVATARDCDMVRGRKAGERREDAQGRSLGVAPDPGERWFDGPEEVVSFASSPRLLHNRHVWMFLYRRDFLRAHDIRFLTANWEERPFLLKALMRARRIALTPHEAVVYRVREDSTTRRRKRWSDLENLIRNVEATAALFAAEEAAGRPLAAHRAFTVAQYLDHVFRGFAPDLLDAPEHAARRGPALERLARAFAAFDVRPDALSDAPRTVNARLEAEGVYGLILAALRAGETTLAIDAVRGRPVAQDRLYARLLTPPAGPDAETAADLSAALNRYARNDRAARVAPAAPASPRGVRMVLHIGATKTGSTHLQHFLDINRPALLRLGVWYPEFGLFWQPDRPHKTAGHADFLKAAKAGDPSLRRRLLDGLALLRAAGAEIGTVALSSEAFFLAADAPSLAAYLDGFEIEMAVYLRRQDEWANSQYCEFVGGGAIGRVCDPPEVWLDSPLTRRRLAYDLTLAAWAEALGDDRRIRVRPYEPAQLEGGDVIADFCAILGVGEALALGALERPEDAGRNVMPLTAAQIAAMRRFNRLPFADAAAYLRFVEAATLGLSGRGGRPGRAMLFPAARRRALLAAHADGNAAIARRWLGRPDGRLFLDDRVPDGDDDVANEVLTVAEIDALFDSYGRHGAPLPTQGVEGAGGPVGQLVNYGLFGWRRAFKPALRPLVRRLGTKADLRGFEADPALFFHSLRDPAHRVAAAILYPRWPIYGPFGVLRLHAPLVARRIERIAGPDDRRRFEGDPAGYFRRLRKPRLRWIGRLLFPVGELPGAER